MIPFRQDDGGRALAGYKGKTSHWVTRAIAIVTGKPYQEVYAALNDLCRNKRQTKIPGLLCTHWNTYLNYSPISRVVRLSMDANDDNWLRLQGASVRRRTASRQDYRKAKRACRCCH
jgi:hypothetical protein